MKKTVGIMVVLGLACAANAAILIDEVGDGTGYDITGSEVTNFYSTGEAKTFDLNGDNYYGTDGYVVFGGPDDNTGASHQPVYGDSYTIQSDPSFGTIGAGSGFLQVTKHPSYSDLDNPANGLSADVAAFPASAIVLANAGDPGGSLEMLTLTVGAGAPSSFRIGVIAGLEGSGDARWTSPWLGLSLDGGATLAASVTTPWAVASETGMVFFDVEVTDGTEGTISVMAEHSNNGAHIGGMTIDVIPEPATLGLLAAFGGGILFIRRRFMM